MSNPRVRNTTLAALAAFAAPWTLVACDDGNRAMETCVEPVPGQADTVRVVSEQFCRDDTSGYFVAVISTGTQKRVPQGGQIIRGVKASQLTYPSTARGSGYVSSNFGSKGGFGRGGVKGGGG